MRGRDEDTRPPIEVLGADRGISSTQQVAVGPPRGSPRRGRAVAASVALVGVLVAGLALGDGADGAAPEERGDGDRPQVDEPQTSTTARRTTTTRPPTTTTAPQGPPLGAPVEGALVLIEGGRWTLIDLADGRQSKVNILRDAAYEVAVVAGGVVVPAGGQAIYHRLLPAPPAPEEVVGLGPADQVFEAADDEQVWLVDGLHGRADGPPGTVDIRLVDLTGRVIRSFRVPGRWVSGVTGDTVLLSRGGRIYATDGDDLRPVATGVLTGVLPGAAVVLSCDDSARCGLWRVPVDGSPPRLLHDVEDPDSTYFDWSTSPQGRLVIAQYSELTGDQVLLLFDQAGRSLGTVPPPPSEYGGLPAWLPGDSGLVLPSGSGLAAIWLSDGEPVVDYLSFGSVSPELVYVLRP